MESAMEILYARNGQQDSDNSDETDVSSDSDETDLLETKLFRGKLISAVEDENEDIVKSLCDEFLNSSDIFAKSWSSDSEREQQENKFEIWRDAVYTAMDKDTKKSEEIMKLPLDCSIIWNLETEMNVFILHLLIRFKNKVDDKKLRLIETILKSGIINVNAEDEAGRTVLHYAKHEKLIPLLIRYGADVNKKDTYGKTPLMPMRDEQVSLIPTILKEAGNLVDLDAVDYSGRTALMKAAIHNRSDVVELLLNAGASVNLYDHLGLTALHHALFTSFDHYDRFPRSYEDLKKRKEIFAILFDAKDELCDWYRSNKEWITNTIQIVEMLLQRPDIDVNVLSYEKFSPLDIAEGTIPQFPSSIKDTLMKKGAVLNAFKQTVSQSTGDFHLDFRCSLALELLLRNVCRSEAMLPPDLLQNRLLSLIETFQDQILIGKDQNGRTALHLVAISFAIIDSRGFIENDEEVFITDLANTIVKELIKIGCSVNETDIYGRTPLHYSHTDLIDSLTGIISHEVEDIDENSAIEEIPQQYSTNSYIVKAATDRNDETCFLRIMNNKQMAIEFKCIESQVRASDDREFWRKKDKEITEFWRKKLRLQTVPGLLWENGEYAFRHPLVEKITSEVTVLMSVIAKEIERLDPRFEIRVELVGSSNHGTRLSKPDEFDFCFVLTKISELCEVSQSPELPTGFVRLKRKPTKVNETSDYGSLFGNDGILNTEKLKWHFTTILGNALVNIENHQSLDWKLERSTEEFSDAIKKVSSIKMMKPINLTSVKYISLDIVPCIRVDGWWPDEAISNVSDEIKTFGCNLIFDRPQKLYPWVPYSESCARISFSKAESDMIKRSCANSREAYMIGKTMIEGPGPNSHADFCGYTLKNCLLYCIEALAPSSDKASQLGLSLEEMESKFHQIDRYLWLKCLMKCYLDIVSQDFCPCYFLPNFSSPIGKDNFKRHSLNWIKNDEYERSNFPQVCKHVFLLYRCTLTDTSESYYQSPAPDPLWERFDRNQLIVSLCKIAYK